MNPFAFLSLLSATIIALFGEYIFLQSPKEQLNRVFAFFCLVLSYWAFCEFMYRSAPTFNMSYFWFKLHVAAGPFSTATFLHFTLVFTGKNELYKRRITYFLIYFPTIISTIIFSATNLSIQWPIKLFGWFNGYRVNDDPTIYLIIVTEILTFATIAIALNAEVYFKSKDARKKQQAKYIILGFFFGPLLPGSITGVLPAFKVFVPFLASISYSLTALFTGYAISKYALFAINPATVADNIISTMADLLVIIDPRGRILLANTAALSLLKYRKRELIGQPAGKIFANQDFASRFWSKTFSQNWLAKNYETEYLTSEKEVVPVLFSSSVIRDKKENIAGIVAIGTDVTELRQAKKIRTVADILQETLLEIPEKIKGVDFGHLYRSATEEAKIGGDFYDIFELNNNKVGIVVGDVSGKGIRAAALASLVKDTIKAYSYQDISPAAVMEKTNELIRKFSPQRIFVTVFFGILNTNTGKLTYCNAGHPTAILSRSIAEAEVLKANSTVIGVFEKEQYLEDTDHMHFGDILAIYTDGVTEARCNNGFFGEDRLLSLVKAYASMETKELPEAIFNKIMECSEGKLTDDIVLLTISRA